MAADSGASDRDLCGARRIRQRRGGQCGGGHRAAAARTDPLDALATFVEGRYKITPGLFAAARIDYLGFGSIASAFGTTPWDAPVTRVEAGGGYSIVRNLLLKVSYQHNSRDGGRLPAHENLVATQVVFWF